MSLIPPGQTRRRSALPVNLGDHVLAALVAEATALDDDLVAGIPRDFRPYFPGPATL
ncbi:MAG TPA: hypothetical protein VKV80_17125 [Streptosporangiaceae bacterium]|nr:hypothetical protein [Streptosporangiaceae bacterium]